MTGIASQWYEDREGQPEGYRFPPVVTPGDVLDLRCEFTLYWPLGVAYFVDEDVPEPERPKKIAGTVGVGDHLGREVTIEIETGFIL
jgi:hypothetical protein